MAILLELISQKGMFAQWAPILSILPKTVLADCMLTWKEDHGFLNHILHADWTLPVIMRVLTDFHLLIIMMLWVRICSGHMWDTKLFLLRILNPVTMFQ